MRSTLALLPVLLLLLLLLPLGGFLGPALTLQCAPSSRHVNIPPVNKTGDNEIKVDIYVRPQGDMPVKVVLEVKKSDNASKISAEFLLDENCFTNGTEWWEMRVKVVFKQAREYRLQVRTTCIRACVSPANMEGLESLRILTFGVSNWTLERPGDRSDIPKWKRGNLKRKNWTQCTDYKAPSSPIPAVISGIAGVAGIIAVVLVAVMRKRRGEAATRAVSKCLKNTESQREDSVNSLPEPAGTQETVHENFDRQGSANSLYETVGRQESVNSLYEPLENFRPTR